MQQALLTMLYILFYKLVYSKHVTQNVQQRHTITAPRTIHTNQCVLYSNVLSAIILSFPSTDFSIHPSVCETLTFYRESQHHKSCAWTLRKLIMLCTLQQKCVKTDMRQNNVHCLQSIVLQTRDVMIVSKISYLWLASFSIVSECNFFMLLETGFAHRTHCNPSP